MRADHAPRADANSAVADLGAITELTLGDLMPNAWESPVLKDLYDPQ